MKMKKTLSLFLLAAMVLGLLSGCTAQTATDTLPTAPVATENPVSTAEPANSGAVEVHNVDELLAALSSDTVIHLNKGVYNLMEAKNYGKGGSAAYYWGPIMSDSYELVLTSVSNLTIYGEGEIVTVPRDPAVLRMRDCYRVSFDGITFGHTVTAEACQGPVVHLEDCREISFAHCRLFGCGTTGIWAYESRDLKLEDCDIYHCSQSAIDVMNTSGLLMQDCRIYEIGTEDDYGAWAVFGLFDTKGVTIRDCQVSDCRATYLYHGWNVNTVSVTGLKVTGSHVDSMFEYTGSEIVLDVQPENNVIGQWFGSPWASGTEYLNYLICLNGEKWYEEDLDAAWGEQLASAGLGTVYVEKQEADYSGTTEVHVSTADELLKAIAPDTTIYIDCERLDLTEASDYGESALEEWPESTIGDYENSYYRWVNVYDGYELEIGNVTNLHLVGAGDGTEIVTQPRYADVLSFMGCGNVSLQGLTLGHSPEPGECSGGVLYLRDSSNILVDCCNLYGCGIIGIQGMRVKNLNVQNTCIYECSWGAVNLTSSDMVNFMDCEVWSVPSPQVMLYDTENFTWNGRLYDSRSDFDPENGWG